MRQLPYHVTIYNCDDEPTSQCKYPTERAARSKYKKAVVSAECANVGRILLCRVSLPARGMISSNAIRWENIAEWIKPVPEPEIQVAGYIVHSARSVNDNAVTSCKSVNKTFYETYDEAEQKARQLCDTWNDKHEGVIIFKAITHVHKKEYIPRRGIRIRVDNVE